MIRIEESKKDIKVGEYYTRVNGVYVVGDGGDLEILWKLYAANGYKRVVFEERLGGREEVRYHYFSFEEKMYRVYSSIQGLLEQFADVYVFDLDEIPPNKKSVKKAVGFLNRKNVVVFGVLLTAIVGVYTFSSKREVEKPVVQQPPPPPPSPPEEEIIQAPVYIPCRTNLPSFAKLFDYSDQVLNGRLLKSLEEKTVEMPLEVMEVSAVEKSEVKLPAGLDERDFNMQDMGDRLIFSLSGYDSCLMFIDLNKSLPLVVEELTMGSCRLSLEKSCIRG
ncbi:hypothetical protein [Thermocrinis sp.]|jgi:hypothetical protein|uniref:hypothetical protein n=1 Tax=Thermocrinis sp. TaxID=2024383 RepID=UPI003BFF7089